MAIRRVSAKTVAPIEAGNPIPEPRVAPRGKPLVFISHDSRDADLAEAFELLLTDISGGVLKSFRASDKKGASGIPFGAEWYRSIMSQLDESTDVVALLTPQSIERPWILYEAGVAKGKLETTVLGVAIGTTLDAVNTGPFGQFQNSGDDEDSLTKLGLQLLKRNPDANPREEAIRKRVLEFRDSVTKITDTRKKVVIKSGEDGAEQKAAKLFEEVKAMVRDLPERIDARVQSNSRGRNSRSDYRMRLSLIEDFINYKRFSERDDASIHLLLLMSVFKDDVPWIFEPGMELYRAIRSGSRRAISEASRQVISISGAMDHPMFMEAFGRDDKYSFTLFRELPHIIVRLVENVRSRYLEKPETPDEKVKSGPAGFSEP